MLLKNTLDSLHKLPLTGFEADSRKISPGSIFVCNQGLNHDSHDFVEEAASRGAIGLIATRQLESTLPCFVMPARAMAVSLISQFYQYPQRKLFNIGVTGTNGKTTVAWSLNQLLNHLHSSAYTGTLGCRFDGYQDDLVNTTPDTVTLLNLMNRMVQAGVRNHVMEVSSHALDQNRVSCMDYDIVVFTNLGEDHIDYHGSRDDYLEAKLRLADRLKPGGVAVVNLDDPMAMAIIDRCQPRASVMTFGTSPGADVFATDLVSGCQGGSFRFCFKGGEYEVSTPLPFDFNIENSLAILTVLLAMDVQPERAVAQLQQLQPVPGRCEITELNNGATAIVDYAHNVDALTSLIGYVRQHTKGRIHTVIGVTGDRLADAEAIGQCCSDLSDRVYFTTDNPMGVESEKLLSAMSEKACPDKTIIIKDREQAIARALSSIREHSESDDILLICGKGPETWQYMSMDKQVLKPYKGDKAAVVDSASRFGLL